MARVTQHNGRAGKNGAYNPAHNDRKSKEKDKHIDETRSSLNRYWQENSSAKNFKECEALFYKMHFEKGLMERNERYIKQGHKDRVQTLDAYRTNEKSCPEETIIQLGKKGDNIDSDKLWNVMAHQIMWEEKQFPNIKYLDIALHRDEEGQDHIHLRKVWIGHDKAGNEIIGQTKALKEMGIEAPAPNDKITRFNNPKKTYSKECREHLIEMVKEYYPEIEPFLELDPKEPSKTGLGLLEYQRRQEQQRLEELRQQIKAGKEALHKLAEVEENLNIREKDLDDVEKNIIDFAKYISHEELNKILQEYSIDGKTLLDILEEQDLVNDIHDQIDNDLDNLEDIDDPGDR